MLSIIKTQSYWEQTDGFENKLRSKEILYINEDWRDFVIRRKKSPPLILNQLESNIQKQFFLKDKTKNRKSILGVNGPLKQWLNSSRGLLMKTSPV